MNTVPLVWGLLHGEQRASFQTHFCVPSECARRLEEGVDDVGIVPVVEIERQELVPVPGTGIACRGAVRSILLISKTVPGKIRTLAADAGSRTSVALSRVILRNRYDTEPTVWSAEPDLGSMLTQADAALLIGDAALRVDPSALPYHVLDLGHEWFSMTRLPMVFALWAGRAGRVQPLLERGIEVAFSSSLEFGLAHLNTIVAEESRRRGFPAGLVAEYLTRHIRYRIGVEEREGMAAFLEAARHEDTLVTSHSTIS